MSQTIPLRYKRVAYSETDLLEGLYQEQEWAVRLVYKTQYRGIKKMIQTFKSSALNPEDVFQEGLTRAILNIRRGTFRGDSSFTTYLNSICRNICLKELNRKKEVVTEHIQENITGDISDGNYDLLHAVLRLRQQLNEMCRKIIDLRFRLEVDVQHEHAERGAEFNRLMPFEKIARLLKISSDNARQRYVRCMKQLKGLAFSNPVIKEYLEEFNMVS